MVNLPTGSKAYLWRYRRVITKITNNGDGAINRWDSDSGSQYLLSDRKVIRPAIRGDVIFPSPYPHSRPETARFDGVLETIAVAGKNRRGYSPRIQFNHGFHDAQRERRRGKIRPASEFPATAPYYLLGYQYGIAWGNIDTDYESTVAWGEAVDDMSRAEAVYTKEAIEAANQ